MGISQRLSTILGVIYRVARMTNLRVRAAIIGALVVVALVAYWTWRSDDGSTSKVVATTPASAERVDTSHEPAHDRDSVDLSDSQLASVKVEPVAEREFPVEKEAVGSIDFDEDMAVQVFTPYQGRIIALYAAVGNDVKKGQTLFTIDSPDLLQAEIDLDRRGRRFGTNHPEPCAVARTL